MKVRFIMNIIFIMLVFSILFSFAMFQGGFISWFLLIGFLPLFLYLLAFSFYPVQKWQITRDLSRQKLEAGGQVIVNIVIQRKIPFPIFHCIIEEILPETLNRQDDGHSKYKNLSSPDTGNIQRNRKDILFPWFKREFTMTYPLSELPRGEHALSEIRIRTGDLFGFMNKEHIFQVKSMLTVYPKKRRLRMNNQAQNLEQGSISSQVLNLKNTNIASGIREYMPGDRFSWIDWKQTARKNTMMTKEFEQEKSTDTLIILDTTTYKNFNELAFEATIELGVSLIALLKKEKTHVGFMSIGKETTFFPVKQHLKTDEAIERHLAKLVPSRTEHFSIRLKGEENRLRSQRLIVILTTHVNEHLIETLKQLKLQRKHIQLIVVQAQDQITQSDQLIVKQLIQNGISVKVLTETSLMKEVIEVNKL